MTPGNEEFVQVCVSLVLSPLLVAAIVVRDERRLTPVQRDRAWPPVSRDAAIFTPWLLLGMPQLCLPVHWVRTRGWWRGLPVGLVLAVLVTAVDFAAQVGAVFALEALGA